MDWDKFAISISTEVGELFSGKLKSYKDAAEKDAKAFLEASKNDIEKWTIELAEGELLKNEYEILVKGKADVLKMLYLKQLGIGKIEKEKFMKGLIKIIVKAAFSLIP